MAWGYLMLEDRSFPLTAVSDSARGYLRTFTPYLLADTADMLVDENDPTVLNACFVLDRTAGAPTYAGVERAGITQWRSDSTGTIRITLFESPDAAYVARIVVGRGRMSGTGRSVMAGHGDVFPRDFIYGRRIGPPQRARCVRDIESAAARQHARARAVRDSAMHRTSPPPRVQPH
jgi:hypothetical protein